MKNATKATIVFMRASVAAMSWFANWIWLWLQPAREGFACHMSNQLVDTFTPLET
jgi:hypothetical protein